jgi:uncharacterized protein (DUF885 family)
MKKLFILSLITLFFGACNNKSGGGDFKARFINALWVQYPEWGVSVGFYKNAATLSLPTADERAKSLAFTKLYADSLHLFDLNGLSPNNQCDYKMLDNYFAKTIWETNDFKEYTWNPANYNVADGLNELLIKPYDKLPKRLADINARLEKVTAYYAAAKTNLTNPTREHTELAVQQHKGTEDVFRIIADSAKAAKMDNLADNLAKARTAVADYVAFLDTKLKDPKATFKPFQIGKEAFDKKFEYDIVSAYTPDQMYEKAQKHKAELHTNMAKLTRELWAKYMGGAAQPKDSVVMIKMMIDKLSVKHTQPAAFVQTIRAQIPTLTKFVADKNLLTLDPTQPLQVRESPKFMRGSAGASVSSPGPYEKNGTTFYNVDPMDAADGWTPEKSESYLREYNDYILQILNIHEAIPGHYAQLVYSNRSPSMVKTLFGNGAMIEGWAVYTERMMLEEGYGNNAPEMWLMYYKWNLRSTCNTIIDIGIQTKGMTKAQVLDLLQNSAFQTQAEAEGKYRRATLSQVQLCSYFTGFSEIYDFRESLKTAQKSNFDLKKFHEKFLSFGSAPVKYVKALMQ